MTNKHLTPAETTGVLRAAIASAARYDPTGQLLRAARLSVKPGRDDVAQLCRIEAELDRIAEAASC